MSRQKCGLYIVGYTQFLHSASPKVWKVRDVCVMEVLRFVAYYCHCCTSCLLQPIIELCRREQSGCIESAIVVKTGHEGTHKCNSPEELEDLVYANCRILSISILH